MIQHQKTYATRKMLLDTLFMPPLENEEEEFVDIQHITLLDSNEEEIRK